MTHDTRNAIPGPAPPQGPVKVPTAGSSTLSPASPAAASKPCLAVNPACSDPASMTRRGFLSSLGVAWTTFAAACAAGAVATTRFMFPNVLFEPPQEFKAGFPFDFQVGIVDQRFKDFGVFIVRDMQEIYVLRAVCTHLGCTPNWLEAENKFKCPCHGSGFYRSGINYEGPAPRPLERYRVVLADDGQILVDKTKIFRQELGEWSSHDSFLKA